jgi:hypothetical protein
LPSILDRTGGLVNDWREESHLAKAKVEEGLTLHPIGYRCGIPAEIREVKFLVCLKPVIVIKGKKSPTKNASGPHLRKRISSHNYILCKESFFRIDIGPRGTEEKNALSIKFYLTKLNFGYISNRQVEKSGKRWYG